MPRGELASDGRALQRVERANDGRRPGRAGIGINNMGHDVHDHVQSVPTAWKRHDLLEVRADRELQGFYAQQFGARQSVRVEEAKVSHKASTERAAAAAEQTWGAAVGAIPDYKARLAQEVSQITGINTTQALVLLAKHGWSIEAAVIGFTVHGDRATLPR